MKLYVEHEFVKDFFTGFKPDEIQEVLREIQLLVSRELDIEFVEPPSDDKNRETNFLDNLSQEQISQLNSFVDVIVLEIQNNLDDTQVELVGIERVVFSESVLVVHLKSIPVEDKEETEDEEDEEEDVDFDDDD